ncbi:MAG TPA: DUF1684 domain-containing protein [Beijerinckiaceae bacterium]
MDSRTPSLDAGTAADRERAARDFADLWDWRRQVAELYGRVRAAPGRPGWELWRRQRDRLFSDHPQSPLSPKERAGFAGLPYFDYDPALRFDVDLVPTRTARREVLDGGRDGVRLLPFARTEGLQDRVGGELTFYWIEGYGGGAFLPFADATNGTETYAGGRYLLDTVKGADLGRSGERVVLDFNFAYNPSCAYSDRWTCPLPPTANRLPHAIQAGERCR